MSIHLASAPLLLLPIGEDGASPAPGGKDDRKRGRGPRPSAPRILVAEDDPDFRSLVVSDLKRAGYEVVSVEDGSTLVEHLATAMLTRFRAPDAVVADVRMPGIDGFRVAAGLRRVHSSIPIILMTAFGDDQTQSEAERVGAVAVLQKPFEPQQLRRLLAELTSRRER